jgi:hypothetical protein
MLSAGIAALVQRGFFALPTNDNYGVARTGRGRWRPREICRGPSRQTIFSINSTGLRVCRSRLGGKPHSCGSHTWQFIVESS